MKNLLRKARKNRIKRHKAYKRGQSDARKEYDIKAKELSSKYDRHLKEVEAKWLKELQELRVHTATQIKHLKLSYKQKEQRFMKSQRGLARLISFWAQKADDMRALSSSNYSIMKEYEETLFEFQKKAGKLKSLMHKLENNMHDQYENIEKVLSSEPALIE